MAFDKCTLLSSQGSDAPTNQSHDQPSRATSLSYLPQARWSNRRCSDPKTLCDGVRPRFRGGSPSRRTVRPHHSRSGFRGGGPPLEGGKALGLSASLWGEQEERYVRSRHLANPGRTPGVSRFASSPRPAQEPQVARPVGGDGALPAIRRVCVGGHGRRDGSAPECTARDSRRPRSHTPEAAPERRGAAP